MIGYKIHEFPAFLIEYKGAAADLCFPRLDLRHDRCKFHAGKVEMNVQNSGNFKHHSDIKAY